MVRRVSGRVSRRVSRRGAERGKEHRLRGQVRVHALRAVRAAGAARPAPAPWRADVRLVEVDAEGADAGPPRDVKAALRVAGPDGGGEPEAVVGQPDGLRLVLVADHRG